MMSQRVFCEMTLGDLGQVLVSEIMEDDLEFVQKILGF
jgi:hypothetical protein